QAASKAEAYSFGIADGNNAESFRVAPEFTSLSGPVLIGSKNIHADEYPSQPLNQGNQSLVFNGILYDTLEPDTLVAANILEESMLDGVRNLINERKGAYAVAVVEEDRIICGLDHIGTIPLYYGENSETKAVASNRRMLASIGIEGNPVQPGTLLRFSEKTTDQHLIRSLRKPDSINVPEKEILEQLDLLFTEASENLASKLRRGTVAFSGGVDSTLIASYLSEAGAQLELITTGLENRPELEIASAAADHLGLPIHTEVFTVEDVEDQLDDIIYSVEEPHPVKIGVAYPFHWTSMKAFSLGYDTVFSGNGADEVFGGYKRHQLAHAVGEDAESMMYKNTSDSWINNFHRDTKTCLDQGTRLILPFTHPDIIEYGLGIPVQLKLTGAEDGLRKIILRKLAKRKGIPDRFSDRPKKAAQYSTGVNKALRKIAKRKRMNVRELILSRFKN
ncbi:asparagine synthetase B, partial [Candidatus Bathyarchaeota archaeon]|nr:asparagine synthetase B [Candidatus Bathyarchaeota archaeon]